jgi:hypothetical protein
MLDGKHGGGIGKSDPGNAIYLQVGVWYNKDDGEIHITGKNAPRFHTRVGADSKNVRGHASLFRALTKCLQKAGAPAPDVESIDASRS